MYIYTYVHTQNNFEIEIFISAICVRYMLNYYLIMLNNSIQTSI